MKKTDDDDDDGADTDGGREYRWMCVMAMMS
jgi:hypothetical protein